MNHIRLSFASNQARFGEFDVRPTFSKVFVRAPLLSALRPKHMFSNQLGSVRFRVHLIQTRAANAESFSESVLTFAANRRIYDIFCLALTAHLISQIRQFHAHGPNERDGFRIRQPAPSQTSSAPRQQTPESDMPKTSKQESARPNAHASGKAEQRPVEQLNQVSQAFQLLGVSAGASAEQIQRAHRQLALRNHPDKVPAEQRAEATRKMQTLNNARDLLLQAQTANA